MKILKERDPKLLLVGGCQQQGTVDGSYYYDPPQLFLEYDVMRFGAPLVCESQTRKQLPVVVLVTQ